MALKAFNERNIRLAASNAAGFIQSEKIRLSKQRIRTFQRADMWPKEYISYSGPVGRNPFRDPVTFFRVMEARPEKYRQRFTFLPATPRAVRDMRAAAALAYETVIRQAYKYGVDTGLYRGSFILFTREGPTRTPLRNLSALTDPGERTVFEILSPLAYASTVEVNALYFAKIGGVLYHAAQKVKRAYPSLAVRYVYEKADRYGLPHVYDVPVLRIGPRQVLNDRIVKPGKNYRRRQRIRRAQRG